MLIYLASFENWYNLCLIDNEELKPLDIVDIPLDNQNNGYEVENLTILPGTWKKIGRVLSSSLLEYSESEIIYSQYSQKVPKSFLDSLKLEERRSLQLIKATVSTIYKTQYDKWEASLSISNQQVLTAKITDIAMIDCLNNGLDIKHKECLFTISLAQPWRKNEDDELSCWKLIAGVIELS